MPVGDYFYINSNNLIVKTLIRVLGTFDLHSHIRLKPMIDFFKTFNIKFQNTIKTIKILEVGCGSGLNAFEIYKIFKNSNINVEYYGFDLDKKSIENALKIKDFILIDSKNIKIEFFVGDANLVTIFEEINNSFDIVLLMDVIEHLNSPQDLLKNLSKIVSNEALFLVSVPTPLYPKFFGRKFHERIGHLKDGYSISELDNLFDRINCERVFFKYNTGLISNLGCFLYYNLLDFNNRYLNLFKSLILYPFKFFDFYNSNKVSCSLFAVYKLRGNK